MKNETRSLVFAAALLPFNAVAADLAAPSPAPVFTAMNWSGLYAGATAGWMQFQQQGSSFPAPAGFGVPAVVGGGLAGGGFPATRHNLNADVLSGGIHLGYNWQSGSFVYGVEADAAMFDRSRRNTQTFTDTCCGGIVFPRTTLEARNNWLATLRARAGFAFNRSLLYVTGGAAFTETRSASRLTPDGVAFPLASSATSSTSKFAMGWVIGAGYEAALSNNWIFRTEYLYHRLSGANVVAPVAGAACPGCRFDIRYSDLQVHNVRVGLSYKFGPSSDMVVAKY